jgi:hypothetical protein
MWMRVGVVDCMRCGLYSEFVASHNQTIKEIILLSMVH